MANFLLASDVNLGIGRWLRGRGNETAKAEDLGCEGATPEDLIGVAASQRQIIITHDERLFSLPLDADQSAELTILIVPQPSLDDIQRIAEAVHQFIVRGRAAGGGRHRLGLRSGWAALD